MKLPLANQFAVVTGASGGIGGALVRELASAGATPCAVGRNVDKLSALIASVTNLATRANSLALDLTQPENIELLRAHVEATFGHLDVLVHCAGAIAHGRLEDALPETLDLLYSANVRAPFALTRALLPLLRKPRGQIVFINSSSGLQARPNAGHFSATQHALKAMADTLRDEVNPEGIRVLSVFPGRTATPRIAALHEREGRTYEPDLLLQPSDIASIVTASLALPWTAEVTNISIRPMQKSY
jgi:NADP-dependent 3-hydroxy acid dehydrogenase YdfG